MNSTAEYEEPNAPSDFSDSVSSADIDDIIKVTVVIVTYNHEKYIRKALESVICQETNFDFEVIVSEDCSSDATRDILMEYEREFEGRLSFIFSETNIHNMDVVTRAIRSARGKYIAFLDGDDYWVSKDKLQKQFDFMESHPDSAITYHDVVRVTEDGKAVRVISGSPNRATIEDLIQGNFIPTGSCMTRRSAIADPPNWIRDLKSGDWPYHLLAAQSGYIDYVGGLVAHYRIHGDAVWSTRPLIEQWVRSLSILMEVETHLGARYPEAFARSRMNLVNHIVDALADSEKMSGTAIAGIETERRAREAEAKVDDYEMALRNAENNAREAHVRMQEREIEVRYHKVHIRELEFAAGVAQGEARAAEARAGELEARRAEAEARASDLEARRAEAEARVREANARGAEMLAAAEIASSQLLHRERSRLRRRERLTIILMSVVILALLVYTGWVTFRG